MRRGDQDETSATIRMRRGKAAARKRREGVARLEFRAAVSKNFSLGAFWRGRPVGRTVDAFPSGGARSLPGRHITDRQKRLFMTQKKTDTIEVAAAKAGFSRATGYRLAADPATALAREEAARPAAVRTRLPISSTRKSCRSSRPEPGYPPGRRVRGTDATAIPSSDPGVRRTLERRIRVWRAEHGRGAGRDLPPEA